MTNLDVRPPRPEVPPVHPRRNRRSLPWPLAFYQTGVGKKWVMGLTGVGLMGFVFAHMVGNFKAYLGADAMNEYGEFLRHLFHPILPNHVALWGMRIGLIVMLVLHIHSAYSLTRMNSEANQPYPGGRDYIAVNFASRTMRWTGIIVALYMLFHLADLTWGFANPEFERGLPYENMVASFDRVQVSILYIAANLALAFHLYHGAWSMFQSMGLNNPRFNGIRRGFATGFAVLIGVGNCLFPVMVLAGVID